MLDDFLKSNRSTILARARSRSSARQSSAANDADRVSGIPVFLDQLGEVLQAFKVGGGLAQDRLSESAARHGSDLFQRGLTPRQVVHDYGDVCQTITELAVQQNVTIEGEEFRILNYCLDDAIAEAVTEFASAREAQLGQQSTDRLGVLAHELRNLIGTAMISFEEIRLGHVRPDSATGLILRRSLLGLRGLVDLVVADVRLDAGAERLQLVALSRLMSEVDASARMHAEARGLQFSSTAVPDHVVVRCDPNILTTALSNLLQNAFKFTRKRGQVWLTTRTTANRVFFDIQDECGGLPPGEAEELFRPYEQRALDRSGLGLGLAICRKAAKALDGEISVRNLPGQGCIFTLELPRAPPLLSA